MLVNLALGKTVTNLVNAKAVTDGDTTKYDGRRGYGHCNWPNEVDLDLGNVYQLEKINLYLWNKDRRYYHYKMFISQDGEAWTQVIDNSEIQSRGLQSVKLPPEMEKARFVKIRCLYNSVNNDFHIVQLEVIGKPRENEKGKRFPIPAGYENIAPSLEAFKKDQPDYEKNVFIMMRFREDSAFQQIEASIRSALSKHKLEGLRADDKVYPADRDLWMNVCTYMLGCKYGIAVFEKFDEATDEYSPNVELEYGFMRAMNKNVLLLKNDDREPLSTDIVGKIYNGFSLSDVVPSIEKQISKWIKDIQ